MMKKSILSLLSLFAIAFVATAQHKEYTGKMNITPLQLEQVGDSLRISIDFDMRGVRVDTRRSISLIPVLVAADGQKKLPEVMVKGRANYLTSKREVALMSKSKQELYSQNLPYAIVKGYKSEASKHIIYKKTIAFEPWMKQARLDIREDLCGCGNPPRSLVISELVDHVQLERVVLPYEITPHLVYVQPAVEMVKKREMVGEVFLDFVVSKIDIRPNYMNNPRELKKIADMMEEVKNDPSIKVNGIYVEGYASPEGTLEFNKYLSKGRANALIEYLLLRFSYPREMYRVVFVGENWSGLSELVSGSNLPEKQQLLSIINNTKVNRKDEIFAINGGDTYRYMLNEYYPTLRKAICKIDYEVRGYDVADAKKVFETNPKNLSLNELYLIAYTHEVGSLEFVDIFETSAKLFPADQTANLNAASAALSRKDIAAAEQYLNNIRLGVPIPEYDNTMGVLEMLKGNYQKAKQHLKSAANGGLMQAEMNLKELDAKEEVKLKNQSTTNL